MNKLSILIVDDEPLARQRLKILVERHQEARIAGVARDGEEALEVLHTLRPDVVLLDVEMPGLNGFDVVERIALDTPPSIIFVTAFDHYAARAFEARAIDYLMKPVQPQRLHSALERARQQRDRLDAEARLAEMMEVIANLRRGATVNPGSRYEQHLWVKARGESVRITLAEVYLIESERDYVRIWVDGRSFLHREPLSSLEAKLDPEMFVRVHRSSIVRRDCIAAIGRSSARTPLLRLRSGEQVRVGRNYASLFTSPRH
ncbi:LytR/AlgR family response regulator transcription factor [Sphingomonas sp.]|uniref:LytR/AlgR family response regulator transcription factor n=1 Tax=Sphingomonas sp. TaxID=28214 RepID=UPI002FDA6B62